MRTIAVAFIHDGSLNGNSVCWGWAIIGIVEARETTSGEIPEVQSSRETSIGTTNDEDSKGAGKSQHTVIGRHIERNRRGRYGRKREKEEESKRNETEEKGPRSVVEPGNAQYKILCYESGLPRIKRGKLPIGKMSDSASAQPEYRSH
jgi:hypothetical protein